MRRGPAGCAEEPLYPSARSTHRPRTERTLDFVVLRRTRSIPGGGGLQLPAPTARRRGGEGGAPRARSRGQRVSKASPPPRSVRGVPPEAAWKRLTHRRFRPLTGQALRQERLPQPVAVKRKREGLGEGPGEGPSFWPRALGRGFAPHVTSLGDVSGGPLRV